MLNGKKNKTTFLAAGLLAAVGFIIWPGCANVPLYPTRQPISSLKRTDFSFKKNTFPNRDDLVSKVGVPDEYFADLRVSVYKLNRMSRRRLWLLLGIIPVAAPKEFDGIEIALIQFDDHDQATRIEIKIAGDNLKWRPVALQWLNQSAKDSGKYLKPPKYAPQ